MWRECVGQIQTLPRASLQDKFAFSQRHLAFYGFIFPVMIRAKCFHQYLLTLTLQLLGLAGSFPAEGQGKKDFGDLAARSLVDLLNLPESCCYYLSSKE